MLDTIENQIFANAYNLLPELGPIKLGRIFKNSNNLKDVWDSASTNNYINFGIDQKTAEIIARHTKKINPEAEFEQLSEHGIKILLPSNPAYPALLHEIPSPPPILYIRGRAEALNGLNLAVVGTRKISPYGKQVILTLVPELGMRQLNIVSGLAFGVDALALQTAVDAGMNTVAVLATSLEDVCISPQSNFTLSQKILDNGCLISEYPLGTQVYKNHFPVRNRLISGISAGTLVIEADEESGSLITANYALEQNRQVFAVPGSIFSQVSRGTNSLIKKGARLVSSAKDIAEEFNLDLQVRISPVNVKASSAEETAVLEVLKSGTSSMDTIIRETKLPAAKVIIAISLLELSGRIKNLGNGTYGRII